MILADTQGLFLVTTPVAYRDAWVSNSERGSRIFPPLNKMLYVHGALAPFR